jgi:hypothetical protein
MESLVSFMGPLHINIPNALFVSWGSSCTFQDTENQSTTSNKQEKTKTSSNKKNLNNFLKNAVYNLFSL